MSHFRRTVGAARRRGTVDVVQPSVRSVSSVILAWNNPSKVVPRPSGVAAGDLLIAAAACDYGADADFTLPAGFTQAEFLTWGNNFPKMIVGWKVAGGSEPANYTFGIPTDADARADVIAVRDYQSGRTPRSSSWSTPAALAHTAPPVMPVTERDLLVTVASADTGTGGGATLSWMPPDGVTELTDSTANGFINLATFSETLTSGSYVTGRTFTMSSSTGAQSAFMAALAVPSNAPLVPEPLRALVYRGGAGGNIWTSKAMADVLLSHPTIPFTVEYIGENEDLKLTAENLAGADLYVQPGGPSVEQGWPYIGTAGAAAVENYVKGGGRYLGSCWGAWVMNANGVGGAGNGFNLTPYPTGLRQAFTPGATLQTAGAAFDRVLWRDAAFVGGWNRWVYCQDPNYFDPRNADVPGAKVMARYNNDNIAALIVPAGSGWAGGWGPHPEATGPDEDDWWHEPDPDGKDWDLCHEFITALMEA